MSRNYKNIVLKKNHPDPFERRRNLYKEVLSYSNPFPESLTYDDIDSEFKRWVEEDLSMEINGEKIPTIALFSNQRFNEYMQSWKTTDNKRNMFLNFKLISRGINPKAGTINGNSRNIPGERSYVMKRVLTTDDKGKEYLRTYRMKQPFSVDFKYRLALITNSIDKINEFNTLVNDKFKSIDCYIRPNGHFLAMRLDDITDNSEYSIDDRRFFSQEFSITIMGYIIPEDSFSIIEEPVLKFKGIDTNISMENSSYADIEELEVDKNGKIPLKITCTILPGAKNLSFSMDCNMEITGMTGENIKTFYLSINDSDEIYQEVNKTIYNYVDYDNYGNVNINECIFNKKEVKNGSRLKFSKVVVPDNSKEGTIEILGFKIPNNKFF